MFFKIPTLVYFEDDCIKKHQEELAGFGAACLIVTGKHGSRINGSLDDLIKVLDYNRTTYYIFDEVEENPSLQTVDKAYLQYKDKKIDFVIGLGGGSPMDAGKAVAVMLYHHFDDIYKLLEKDADHKHLPFVAIPTTCGTGSEVTAAAVVTNDKRKTKQSIGYRVYPELSLVDSKYLYSLPDQVLINSSIDALAHLIESYISSRATDFSNMLALEGLRVWGLNKENLLNPERLTKRDYENLMLASVYGGMAIAHCGTSLPHGFSYTLTYNLDIPHGNAVGYFIYGYLKYADWNDVKKVLDVTGFENLRQLKDYLIEIGKMKVMDNSILDLAVEELSKDKRKLSYCPYPVDENLLKKIAYAYEND
jgi:alcohol dehydrogenase class IV